MYMRALLIAHGYHTPVRHYCVHFVPSRRLRLHALIWFFVSTIVFFDPLLDSTFVTCLSAIRFGNLPITIFFAPDAVNPYSFTTLGILTARMFICIRLRFLYDANCF